MLAAFEDLQGLQDAKNTTSNEVLRGETLIHIQRIVLFSDEIHDVPWNIP